MDTLNKRIKELRKSMGMTQVEMATTLGITQSAYQQIESSKTDSMRVSTFRKFCQEFNVSADWLLGIDRGEESSMIAKPNQMRNAVYRAGEALQKERLTDNDKQVIIDQLQALIDQLR